MNKSRKSKKMQVSQHDDAPVCMKTDMSICGNVPCLWEERRSMHFERQIYYCIKTVSASKQFGRKINNQSSLSIVQTNLCHVRRS
jgi:hypothetical protein